MQNGLVSFTITVGSHKIDHTVYPIVSLIVDKTVSKIPYAKITLHDGDPAQYDFPVSNSQVFGMGSDITIAAGYGGEEHTIFKGVITKHALHAKNHTAPLLIIDCKDIAYRTTLLPKNVSFGAQGGGILDSKILKEVVADYSGLSINVDATSVKHESLTQAEVTDWDFINLRAEANGQVVFVDDGKISVEKPNVKQSASAAFTYGENMHGFEVAMDARAQLKGVEGKVWEMDKQASKAVSASEPGEHSFGDVGYSKLAGVNKQSAMTLYHGGELAEKEMETLAKGVLALSRLAKIRGKITAEGGAAIKPGQVVEIEKGAKNFQGKAYVTGVQHQITEGSWVMELTLGLPNQRYVRKYNDIASLPAAGMLPPIHGLQVGVVKKIMGDPKTAYRLFVCLPMIHKSNEGIWCRIASFYASKEAGAFFMPELGDEVIIGFINADPRSAIILGSLYSATNKPPAVVDEVNSTKIFTSKSKLTLSFNDKDQEIIIKTPGERTIRISDKDSTIEIINGEANKVILGEKNVDIFSKQDITLDANRAINLKAGDSITLKASNAVNIGGSNVSVNADMKASISGKSSAELNSNATTIVKGTMVRIN